MAGVNVALKKYVALAMKVRIDWSRKINKEKKKGLFAGNG